MMFKLHACQNVKSQGFKMKDLRFGIVISSFYFTGSRDLEVSTLSRQQNLG